MRGSGALVAAALLLTACDRYAEPGERFVELHQDHAWPRDPEVVGAELLATVAAVEPEPLGLDADELRRELRSALGIGFLLDRLTGPEGPWRVELGAAVDHRGERAYPLTVHDPALPEPLTGLVLAPARIALRSDGQRIAIVYAATDRPRPLPAILGLHGHFDDAETFRTDYLGSELAQAGHIVVMPNFTAMDCSLTETETSIRLLENGFSLIGVRVYQAALLTHLMRRWPAIDPARIGLLTHSGGSSTGNLLVRLIDGIRIQATDYQVDFDDRCRGLVHCETVPALHRLAGDLKDLTTLRIPHLQVSYAFPRPEQRAQIMRFFELHLGARRS